MISRLLFVLALAASVLFGAGCGRRVQKAAKQEQVAKAPRGADKATGAVPAPAGPAPQPATPSRSPTAPASNAAAELEAEKAAYAKTKNDLLVMTKKYAEAEREIERLKVSPLSRPETEKASGAEAAQQKLLALAREFYDSGKYEPAKKALGVLMDLGYKGGYAYFMLARCSAELGDTEGAISYYKMTCDFYEPVEPKPKYYLYALNNLGALLREQGRYNEARTVYERAQSANPDYAPVHYNLGVLYADYLNDKRRAIEHYQKYIDLKGERFAEVHERVQKLLEDLKKE